jgi:hypothetical protein
VDLPTFSFANTMGPTYRFAVSTICNVAPFAADFEVLMLNFPSLPTVATEADPRAVTMRTLYPCAALPSAPVMLVEAASTPIEDAATAVLALNATTLAIRINRFI